jgi:hypothetical protein
MGTPNVKQLSVVGKNKSEDCLDVKVLWLIVFISSKNFFFLIGIIDWNPIIMFRLDILFHNDGSIFLGCGNVGYLNHFSNQDMTKVGKSDFEPGSNHMLKTHPASSLDFFNHQ